MSNSGVGNELLHFLRQNYKGQDGKINPTALAQGISAFQATHGNVGASYGTLMAVGTSVLKSSELGQHQPPTGVFSGILPQAASKQQDVTLGLDSIGKSSTRKNFFFGNQNGFGFGRFGFLVIA